MSDEGFREIQLNGKQLVFLFMAATVVLVVTFLFGVLVGRGVAGREPRREMASADVSPDPAAAARPRALRRRRQSVSAMLNRAPADAQPAEELSYAERLLVRRRRKRH